MIKGVWVLGTQMVTWVGPAYGGRQSTSVQRSSGEWLETAYLSGAGRPVGYR